MTLPRRFDHLVLASGDLAAQADLYGRMGFTLTPRAAHPWGTGNHLVQLQGNFLELLGLDDPARIPPHQGRHFSFGAYSQGFIARRDGMSMLVFASGDAAADRDEFAAAGLSDLDRFDFGRDAKLPDGSTVRVGFSLAFVTQGDWPDAVFFVCQQHAPQHFWKPEYQRHANTARSVVEVVMAAPNPAAVADRLSRLTRNEAVPVAGGLRFALEAGQVLTVLGHAAVADRWPGASVPNATLCFLGYRIVVDDMGAARRCLEAGGVPFTEAGGRLVVGAADALGATIELESD